jgi:hypothetical protein
MPQLLEIMKPESMNISMITSMARLTFVPGSSSTHCTFSTISSECLSPKIIRSIFGCSECIKLTMLIITKTCWKVAHAQVA